MKNGYARFIAQFGGSEKDIPQLADLVTQPDALRLVKLITTQGDIARLTAGPPGIAEVPLRALREAYRAALSDKDFEARAEKLEKPVEALYGEEVAKRVSEALNQTPEVTNLLVEGFKKAK